MSRSLLLNVREPEEQRALLLEDGRPSLYWVERADERSLVGNVYRGRVIHLEPAIGAAFVEIGQERPGFLHADDVLPTFRAGASAMPAFAERAPAGANRAIDELLAKGQELVVQVTRDPLRNKGATLTTHISLAARTVVLLPSLQRVGVSRRIVDPEQREAIRARIDGLGLPDGMGIVVRTAGAAASVEELERETRGLLAELAAIRAGFDGGTAPALLRQEGGFVVRAIRDLLMRRVEGAVGDTAVHVDTASAAAEVRELFADSDAPAIDVHGSDVPLFHAFDVETEVRRLTQATVPLKGGASLVIQGTEALWAIDVNSGRLRRGANLEETALDTDLLAAREAARQIRLRDLGGLIVVDFIDCRDPDNRARVEEAFRTELAKDPARLRVAPMSEFMVAEITRRRLRHGAAFTGSEPCPCCDGRGRVARARAAGLAVLRDLRALLADSPRRAIELHSAPDVAKELERRAAELEALRATHGIPVHVRPSPGLPPGTFRVARAKSG